MTPVTGSYVLSREAMMEYMLVVGAPLFAGLAVLAVLEAYVWTLRWYARRTARALVDVLASRGAL